MKPQSKFHWQKAMHGVKMNPNAYRVIVTVADYCDGGGDNGWPGVERLAEDTGLSERSVRTHLKWACEEGWLVQVSQGRRGFDGRGWYSVYSLAIPDAYAAERGVEASATADHKEPFKKPASRVEAYSGTVELPPDEYRCGVVDCHRYAFDKIDESDHRRYCSDHFFDAAREGLHKQSDREKLGV